MTHHHRYRAHVAWEGNLGTGTARYAGYSRDYRMRVEGKPDLAGSADPAFHGDPARHNPEDLLLGAISACHMLTYLALCASAGVVVEAYEDSAAAVMRTEPGGGGRFESVTLHPRVRIAAGSDAALAAELHERAHALCFIANSCSVPIAHRPEIVVSDGDAR
jgi:organic hydroperoxide reductase OsmC/OhrA